MGKSIEIEIPNFISVKYVPENIENLQNPYLFAYKYWCIIEEFKNSNIVLYSDSTHLYQMPFSDLESFFYKDCLILPYACGQFKIKNWTTKKCIEALNAEKYQEHPQIWAGFQGYKKSSDNESFLNNILLLCLDKDLSGPEPWIAYPDGKNSYCNYHRNDQSILSIELLKNNLYPPFCEKKDFAFGDFISVKAFYPDQYKGDLLNSLSRILNPRYFKYNN
jgi:hypothetical protein